MLTGNQFTALPSAIRHCQSLQLLRMSLNQLQTFPLWLLDMPQLAWLAFSGNPCCQATTSSTDILPNRHISEFILGEKLGEGASSLVYKVTSVSGMMRTVCFPHHF